MQTWFDTDSPLVTITAIYDLPTAARRVEAMFEHVNAQFGEPVVDLHLWREDALRESGGFAQARADAARSSLLAVSFAGEARVDERLEALVDEWARTHQQIGALVVLLDQSPSHQSAAAILRHLAQEHSVDFIATVGDHTAARPALSEWPSPPQPVTSAPDYAANTSSRLHP